MGPPYLAASNTTSITQIDEQIESHRQAIIALSFRRNSLSVMQSIPVDVLVYIFLWYKDIVIHECELSMKSRPGAGNIQMSLSLVDRLEQMAGKPPSDETGGHPVPWITLSQVCSHWRQVALDCGPFWSTVFLNNVQWSEKLLRLSGKSELEVLPDPRLFYKMPRGAGEVMVRREFHRARGYETVSECLRLVLTNASSRVSSLRVYTTAFPFGFDLGGPMTVGSLASLKDLSIVQDRQDPLTQLSGGGEVDSWEIALLRRALSDSEVRLTRLDVFLTRPSPSWLGTRSAHITHLRISCFPLTHSGRNEAPSLAGIVAMLRGFPGLRELALRNIMDNGSTIPSDTVTLPYLTHIEILDCTLRAVAFILDPLRVTSLAKARVRCVTHEPPPHGAAVQIVSDDPSGDNARRDINSLFSSLNRLFLGIGNGDVPSKGKSRAISSNRRSLLISFDNGAGVVDLAFSPNDDINMRPGHGDDGVGHGMFAGDYGRDPEAPPSGNISDQASLQISLVGIGHLQDDIPTFLVEKELVQDVESVVLLENFRLDKCSIAVRDVYTPWLQMLSSLPHLQKLALYIGPKDAQEALLEVLDAGSELLSDGVEERGSGDNELNFKGLTDLKICFPRSPFPEFLHEQLGRSCCRDRHHNSSAPLPLTSALHPPQAAPFPAPLGVPMASVVHSPLTHNGLLGHLANAPPPPSFPVPPPVQNNTATGPSTVSSSSGVQHGGSMGSATNGGPPPASASLSAPNTNFTVHPVMPSFINGHFQYVPPGHGPNLASLSVLRSPSTTLGSQNQFFPAYPPMISPTQPQLPNHIPANANLANISTQHVLSPSQPPLSAQNSNNSGGHGSGGGGEGLTPADQARALRYIESYLSGDAATRRQRLAFDDWDPRLSSVRSLPEVLRARQYHGYRVQSLTFVPVQAPEYNWLMEEWAEECVTLDVANEVLLDPGLDGI